MEIKLIDATYEYKGPFGSDNGLLLQKVFLATMNGGISHFTKHFSFGVIAQSKSQYNEFVSKIEPGQKVTITTISQGYSQPRLVDYKPGVFNANLLLV